MNFELSRIAVEVFSEQDRIISGLFPSWQTFVLTLLSVLILFLFIRKFAFKKILERIRKRQNSINEKIEKTNSNLVDSKNNIDKSLSELDNAKQKSIKIINNAKVEANEINEKLIIEANIKAEKIIANSQLASEQKLKKMLEEKDEVIKSASIEIAKSLVKKMDEKALSKEIDNLISEI